MASLNSWLCKKLAFTDLYFTMLRLFTSNHYDFWHDEHKTIVIPIVFWHDDHKTLGIPIVFWHDDRQTLGIPSV